MTVDIELFLTRHPFLFLFGECSVKGFDGLGVLATVCGSRGNIHPFLFVESTGFKLIAYAYRGKRLISKADFIDYLAATIDDVTPSCEKTLIPI